MIDNKIMPIRSYTIKIAQVIAPLVSSRDAVETLRKPIRRTSATNIILDFNDVQFISRSAAHQLLVMKDEFASKLRPKKIISFINTNSSVTNMLRLVAANRVLSPKKKIKFNARMTNIRSLTA